MKLTLFLGGIALIVSAVAQAGVGLPAEHQAGNVTYVTGGVSEEEAAAFKQMKGGYPLSIELDEKQVGARTEFTADATVKVIDRTGNVVLDAKAQGPFMLVRLAPGQYKVVATLNGRTVESKMLTVGAQGTAQATLMFPAKTD